MRHRLLAGVWMTVISLVLGVLWGNRAAQAIQTHMPTPVDSDDLRVFPGDLVCDKREETIGSNGPSWLGITIGLSSLEDVEQLISTFGDDEYVFIDDDNYDIRFVASNLIRDESQFPSSVRLCLERNVIQVLAVGYSNGLLAPRPNLSDFMAQFGTPDAITWTDNPASRIAFWFEHGIAAEVTVISNNPDDPHLEPTFGRVEVEIYFPHQETDGYENRWPYNQTRQFNPYLSWPYQGRDDYGPENPFDFEAIAVTMTAQPPSTVVPLTLTATATP